MDWARKTMEIEDKEVPHAHVTTVVYVLQNLLALSCASISTVQYLNTKNRTKRDGKE
jgi:hypothetical protein